MGVYIKRMDMPKNGGKIIILTSSGCVEDVSGQVIQGVEAVEVKAPHGRMIDADALKKIIANAKHMDADIYNGKTMYSDHLCVGADYDDVCAAVDEAPTIIEAEGKDDG